jgi:hypothetical protein
LLGGSLHPKEHELTTTAGRAEANTFPAPSLSERKGLDMEGKKGTETKRTGEAAKETGKAAKPIGTAKASGADTAREQGTPISTPHDKGYKKSLSRPSEFLHFQNWQVQSALHAAGSGNWAFRRRRSSGTG